MRRNIVIEKDKIKLVIIWSKGYISSFVIVWISFENTWDNLLTPKFSNS